MIRVLIPTDFSNHSLNALMYAQYLLKGVETEFTFFHAYEPSALQLVGNKSPLLLSDIYNRLKMKAEDQLEVFKAEVLSRDKNETYTYNTKAYSGHLKDGIKDLDASEYDYIVMGSKGATGLKELFMGSVAYSIVSLHQKIPLLIIPEKAAFVVPETIGFATDFVRDYSKEELEPLIYLTKLWKATLRMVEVYKKPKLSESQKDHSQHLENLLAEVEYRFHVVPEFSSLENCINVFDDELEINLLVMIDYPKTFFERIMREPIIKKMSFHTTLPFLILPARN